MFSRPPYVLIGLLTGIFIGWLIPSLDSPWQFDLLTYGFVGARRKNPATRFDP